MNKPTDTELRVLRNLGIAFREMQTRIEARCFDEATRAEIVATLAEIIRQVNAMDFPFMEAPS